MAVLVLLGALVPSATFAQSGDNQSVAEVEASERERIRPLAAHLAKQTGRPVAELEDELWWQSIAAQEAYQLAMEDGSNFASWFVEGRGAGAVARFRFAGSPSGEVGSEVLKARELVKTDTDAQRSRMQTIDIMGEISAIGREAGYETVPSTDYMTGIVVNVQSDTPDHVVQRIRESAPEAEVEYGNVPKVERHGWAVGGGELSNGSSRMCTTGLPVKRNGVAGFLTAGHCFTDGNAVHMRNEPGVYDPDWRTIASSPREINAYEPDGDWAFFTTAHTVKDRFVWNSSDDIKYLHGVGIPGSNQTVCYFGQFSNPATYACGYWDRHVTTSFGEPLEVLDRDAGTIRGDSGGPVFHANTGFGVVVGEVLGDTAYTSVTTVHLNSGATYAFDFE